MDLLIDQEVFKQFFFKDAAELLSEKDVLLFNIFNNKNASIIVNKQVILNLLSEAGTDEKKVVIKRYFDHLRNNSRMLSIADFASLTDFSKTQTAYQSHEDANHFLIVISNEKDNTIDADNYFALEDENVVEKNTEQYNIAQIAAHNRLTIRHLDFQNNTEIYNYFNQIFNFVPFNEVKIIDRYLNFLREWTPFDNNRSYTIFENLRNKFFVIYTLNAESKDFIHTASNDFELSVGSRYTVFSTDNPSIIHERKLFFHNFIIETDEDLVAIHANRETWKVDIHYDKNLSQELQSKLQNFTPFERNNS